MATHEGPVMVMEAGERNETKSVLEAFEFQVDENHCNVVSSNISPESFQLCPAYKNTRRPALNE